MTHVSIPVIQDELCAVWGNDMKKENDVSDFKSTGSYVRFFLINSAMPSGKKRLCIIKVTCSP